MLTIFSTPRPFKGVFDTIQRNAIRSWQQLSPKCEIILVDDEENTTQAVAKELGIHCILDIKKNEYGTLFLDDVLQKVRAIAKNPILAQVNSDIILFNHFVEAIASIKAPAFYLTGQRWNIDVDSALSFEPNWETKFLNDIKTKGELHPPTGMDYWVFPKNWNFHMPQFLVGRPAVDGWFIREARRAGIPTIDGTPVITIAHQNHPRKYGTPEYEHEFSYNLKLVFGSAYDPNDLNYIFQLSDSNYKLEKNGPQKKPFTFDKIKKYRRDIELLPGPRFFWEVFFLPYKLLRQIYHCASGKKLTSRHA